MMSILRNRPNQAGWAYGILALLISACGASELPTPTAKDSQLTQNNADSTGTKGPKSSEVVNPDDGYFRAILERKFALISASSEQSASSNQKTLYINFEGAMVRNGFGRGESFLLCAEDGLVAASSIAKSDQEKIIKMVKDFFDGAKVNLNVTTTKPSSTSEYTVIHVGGTADDLGCSNEAGYLGKSPFDRDNANASDVAFVFDQKGASNHQVAVAIANQAGHSYGLDSLVESGSVMSQHYTPAITGFGSGTQLNDDKKIDHVKQLQSNLAPYSTKIKLLGLQNGSTSNSGLSNLPAELSRITGIDVIAALGALLNDFKSGKPMDISKVLSQIDATVPGGINNVQNIGGLQGIEDLLSVIILSAEAAAKQNGGTVQSNGIETLLKVFLDPKQLKAQDLLSIAGLAAQIGLAAATGGASAAIVAAINIIVGGLQGSTPPANAPTLNLAQSSRLPKFDELLGVEGVASFQALVANLEAHATIVNSNFRGNSRQALLTMLKIGYSQLFLKLQSSGLN